MIAINHEQQKPEHKKLPELYDDLIALEPKPIATFVPVDSVEQKQLFLESESTKPNHYYDKLSGIDFEKRYSAIDTVASQILASPELNPKFSKAYEQFVEKYRKQTRMIELARDYKGVESEEQKVLVREEYMRLNIDMYGEPREDTYRSLLAEKLDSIKTKDLDGKAAELRDELLGMLPNGASAETIDRFRPSTETVEWMRDVVESMYGDMLAHIPGDKEIFDVQEAQAIFQTIIDSEFGEAADGWVVDIEPAKSINVKSTEKRMVIPEDRGELSRGALRKLVVHEIGVHMLRSVIGEETNLQPLANGLNEYYEAEEGLGMVMEQALEGKATERGVDHYITAGLAYHDSKDFRGIFEAKWRLAALTSLVDGEDITPETIEKSRNVAYAQTMRVMRGTDELPWFKDLAYYNGSNDVWRHLENIRGDDIKFMFVLMGKANPANIDHERLQYESSTP